MRTFNKNGVSTTQVPGQEYFVTFIAGAFRGTEYYQYDYPPHGWQIVHHDSENA